jgi:hypothetical protein
VEKLRGDAKIEVLWNLSPNRDELEISLPARSQEDRLNDVENTLKQVLKTLEELTRLNRARKE